LERFSSNSCRMHSKTGGNRAGDGDRSRRLARVLPAREAGSGGVTRTRPNECATTPNGRNRPSTRTALQRTGDRPGRSGLMILIRGRASYNFCDGGVIAAAFPRGSDARNSDDGRRTRPRTPFPQTGPAISAVLFVHSGFTDAAKLAFGLQRQPWVWRRSAARLRDISPSPICSKRCHTALVRIACVERVVGNVSSLLYGAVADLIPEDLHRRPREPGRDGELQAVALDRPSVSPSTVIAHDARSDH
jgi:hypothetical protein